MKKAPLLVTGPDPLPNCGSEAGKAFHWTKALSQFFEVHVVCIKRAAQACEQSGQCGDWIFHAVDLDHHNAPSWRYYRFYRQWCRLMISKCREIIPQVQPVGLHHPALGSFRMLPDYDSLSIPYTLGPLGGGETAPWRLLLQSSLPSSALAKELFRPVFNYSCLLIRGNKRIIKNARMILTTTEETDKLLRWAGARQTAIVFPDVVDLKQSRVEPISVRKRHCQELAKEFRCVWSGRFLWWKGGQLAIRFLKHLRQSGCNASLDIYSDGDGIHRLKAMAKELGLEKLVRFNGLVKREELLKAYLNAHFFVYPTLHDSSSSAIPEAYSMALPSMTLALGGTRTATESNAGFNKTPLEIETWLAEGVQLVKNWIRAPDLWLAACDAAIKKSSTFSQTKLVDNVQQHLVPHFLSPQKS